MPICIKNKEQCTACGACYNICPKDCIVMKEDDSGFCYPIVDQSVCINCNLCLKACPINKDTENEKSQDHSVYAAWSKNKNVRFSSTSGGVFSEIAYEVLRHNGRVCGAAYREDNLVEHIIINNMKDVDQVKQSKYIQSEIGYIFRKIKEELNEGTLLLFVGAPCQVAGIKEYLGKEYNNLITLDFICRGMNSPKAYVYWLMEIEKIYNSKIQNVWFKYKKYGWKESPKCTKFTFQNGKECIADADGNYFMRGYLEGNLYLRPSCSQCQFKGELRSSDITLADFWSVPKDFDDDCGTSMVMINSDAGTQIFNMIKENIVYHKRSFDEISKGNICFRESAQLNPKGEEFLRSLGTKPFSKLIKEYSPVSVKSRIRKKISRLKKNVFNNLNSSRSQAL